MRERVQSAIECPLYTGIRAKTPTVAWLNFPLDLSDMVFTAREGAQVPSSSSTIRLSAPFASLSFGLPTGLAQQRRASPFACIGLAGVPQKESSTGTEFPGEACVFSHGKQCPKLTGVGCVAAVGQNKMASSTDHC